MFHHYTDDIFEPNILINKYQTLYTCTYINIYKNQMFAVSTCLFDRFYSLTTTFKKW